jgi:hypothetical protein
MNHAAHPLDGPSPDGRITNVTDGPIDGRIVPVLLWPASCETTNGMAGKGHVPRDVSADEAAGPRNEHGPS